MCAGRLSSNGDDKEDDVEEEEKEKEEDKKEEMEEVPLHQWPAGSPAETAKSFD